MIFLLGSRRNAGRVDLSRARKLNPGLRAKLPSELNSFEVVTCLRWLSGCNGYHYNMVIPAQLLQFINEARQPLPPVNDADEKLHLDSLAMIKLVAFLESDLGYTVDDSELTVENFETLNAVSRLLEGKGSKLG